MADVGPLRRILQNIRSAGAEEDPIQAGVPEEAVPPEMAYVPPQAAPAPALAPAPEMSLTEAAEVGDDFGPTAAEDIEMADAKAALMDPTAASQWQGHGGYTYAYTPASGNKPAKIKIKGGHLGDKEFHDVHEGSAAFKAIMSEFAKINKGELPRPSAPTQNVIEFKDDEGMRISPSDMPPSAELPPSLATRGMQIEEVPPASPQSVDGGIPLDRPPSESVPPEMYQRGGLNPYVNYLNYLEATPEDRDLFHAFVAYLLRSEPQSTIEALRPVLMATEERIGARK